MKYKNTIMNAALMVCVILLATGIIMSRYQEPDPYTFEPSDSEIVTEETEYSPSTTKKFINVGNVEIFKNIVPTPTPRPTRVVTPTPTPDLRKIMLRWKLQGVTQNQISIVDSKTKSTFSMRLGDSVEVEYSSRETIEVKLESINLQQFSATFSYMGQRGELGMFK